MPAEKSLATDRRKADVRMADGRPDAAAPRQATARGISRVVRGKVTDATSGAPLPGVSIASKAPGTASSPTPTATSPWKYPPAAPRWCLTWWA
jgi:hypothetical protein